MPEQPKIQFTPAQAAAISARGGSLLVSAAAGSGKPAYWSSASSGLSPTRSTRWTRTSCSL